MDELESQIAKISLGNPRSASSFVYVSAEKAQGSDAELFTVIELPLFNPAAEDACQQISLAIAGTLKRAYRRPLSAINFELAISQVNEELSKLASLGQTHWINQLNAILAVKIGHELHISSTGKVAAYLMRRGDFTDISCSADQVHPLKAFENFATGKIRLDDLIILSTTQIFNYLSMDRLKQVLQDNNFLKSTQTIIELLKENAGPDVAFGTLLNLQVPAGQAAEEEIDLENYEVEQPGGGIPLWQKTWNIISGIIAPARDNRQPAVSLPKITLGQKINKWQGKVKLAVVSCKGWAQTGKIILGRAFSGFRPQNFKQYTPEKKFFFVSALVLLVTFVCVLFLAWHYRGIQQRNNQISAQIKAVTDLANKAESAMFYNNDAQAADLIAQAEAKMPQNSLVTNTTKEDYNKAAKQLSELKNKLEKNTNAQVEVISSLGQADSLIKLPALIATQSNGTIVSYDKSSGQIKDGVLKNKSTILNSVFVGKNQAVIYSGKGLSLWDTTSGQNGAEFTASVPDRQNAIGLALYATNNRVYMADKASGQIISFLVGTNTVSRPIVAVKDPAINGALDLAIDGSIYVLTDSGIIKFQAGKLADFSTPTLAKRLSGKGKIYTDKDTKNIYVLDAGNNRIVIFDKKGAVVTTLTSKDFTNIKDFQVDEKNKVIYVLNDSTLLKVSIP